MNPDQRRALNLLASCGRNGKALLPAGHALINRHVAALLRAGMVCYTAGGYALTPAGKAAL